MPEVIHVEQLEAIRFDKVMTEGGAVAKLVGI